MTAQTPNRNFARRVISAMLILVVTGWSVPSAIPAQDTIEAAAEQARRHLRDAEYDEAITILRGSIETHREELRSVVDQLQELYLLLIKTYVVRSNSVRFHPQGLETSRLFMEEARRTTLECLQVKELRGTRPDPGGDYPVEMIALFNEVTADIFGSLRVTKLEPANATVILDGDTLSVIGDEGFIGADNIPVGSHLLFVRGAGYQDITEELEIAPNALLQNSYVLSKNRGFLWYATRGAIAAAGVAAAFLCWAAIAAALSPLRYPAPPTLRRRVPGPSSETGRSVA